MNILSILLLSLLFISACDSQAFREGQKMQALKKIDFDQVAWFAERANAAYMDEAQIRDKFPHTIRVAQVADTDVQYFLEQAPQKKYQVVSVRGTANLKDGLEDLEYLPMKNDKLGIYVHRGFNEDTIKMYAELLPHLDKKQPIYITGHSLGAAISALLMIYLHEDGFQVKPSINFGQPKVTNKKGADRYAFLPLTRVVDENDLVPLVPPITLLDSLHGRYEHFGDEVILLKDQYYVYLDEHNAERQSVASFWDNLGHESVKDHFMTNYLIKVKDKLVQATQVPYKDREGYVW